MNFQPLPVLRYTFASSGFSTSPVLIMTYSPIFTSAVPRSASIASTEGYSFLYVNASPIAWIPLSTYFFCSISYNHQLPSIIFGGLLVYSSAFSVAITASSTISNTCSLASLALSAASFALSAASNATTAASSDAALKLSNQSFSLP